MDQKQGVATIDLLEVKIIKALESAKREGMKNLIGWLYAENFFESPASHRFHGAYKGGLSHHSFNVYKALGLYDKMLKLETPADSLVIAGLLHDICKVGAYVRTKADDGWTNNRDKDKGHAKLSLIRINQFMELTELEEKMILYHMGIYGLVEFQDPGKEHKGEYTLRHKGMANAWYHHPIVKVMYFCDELCTLEEKAEERK